MESFGHGPKRTTCEFCEFLVDSCGLRA
jgi:hypothetical protein